MGNLLSDYRKKAGLTQVQLADMVGVVHTTVGRWEKGREVPKQYRAALARALGIKEANILFDREEIRAAESTVAPLDTRTSPQHLPIVGEVAAGVFRESVELDRNDWTYVFFPPDDRYPGIDRFCLKVKGTSMNKIYPEGSIVLCVGMIPAELEPVEGKIYVVDRVIHEEYESTLKELRYSDGKKYLWPCSTDPAHQQPIEMNGNDGEEITLRALVIGAYVVR